MDQGAQVLEQRPQDCIQVERLGQRMGGYSQGFGHLALATLGSAQGLELDIAMFQRRFGLLAVGDVLQGADQARHLPLFVGLQTRPGMHPTHCAIATQNAVGDIVDATLAHALFAGLDQRQVVGQAGQRPALASLGQRPRL